MKTRIGKLLIAPLYLGLGTLCLGTLCGVLASTSCFAQVSIIDGIEALTGEFPEVYSITWENRLCSAVLIHPQILLTAAHCLPKNTETSITVANEITSNYIPHPLYRKIENETEKTGYDFGIVILSQAQDVKPVGLASIENTPDLNSAFTARLVTVGFGGKNTIYQDLTTGVKRWATTEVAEVASTFFITNGPKAGLSHGDSGGPAYLSDRNGSRRLIGIGSGTSKDPRTQITGKPETSFYAGLRPELVCWIEEMAGKKLPEISGTTFCEKESRFGVK